MCFRLQLMIHPEQHFGTDILCPVFQTPRCPLLLFLMALGHVGRLGRGAGLVLAWMRGPLSLPEVEGDQGVTGMQLQCFTDVLVRYRVVVPAVLYVIVDIDLDRFDLDITIGVYGQRLQCRFVQLFESLPAVAR